MLFIISFEMSFMYIIGGENIAAYTLDAGPNPHIIVKKENIKKVGDALKDSGL